MEVRSLSKQDRKHSKAMDSSLAIVPYMPYQEISPDHWAPLVVLLVLLGACLEAAPANLGEKQEEEVHILEEPVVPSPVVVPELPVMKKEPRPQIEGLEDMVLASLHKRRALRAKDVVPKIRAVLPDIKKSDINSCLYKLLAKKRVVKSEDATPLWTLSK